MKKLLLTQNLVLYLCLIFFVSCKVSSNTSPPNTPDKESQDMVFTHVNLLPMTSQEILNDQTLWIQNGKIKEIGKDVSYPSSAKVIDASGKYLMPGIAEMHAHIPVPKGDNDDLVKETLFLYLANGITTIRGMLGNPYHIKLKEQIAKEEILSPRVYTSSTSMNGNSIQSTEEADEKVRREKNMGYDFLKIHPGIKREVFDQLVQTAKEVGILYAGHVPLDVGIRHALNSDYASVDHLDGYLEGMLADNHGVNINQNGFFGFNFTEIVDPAKMDELARLTKEKGVAVVPTQTLFTRWLAPGSPDEMAAEPEMKYMNPRTLDNWKKGKFSMQASKEYSQERFEKFLELRHHIIRSLYKADVLFLMGSDAPQVFNVPGFSIHHEIQSIIDAGIPPYEVLKSGTVNPAKYFGQEGEYGTLEVGASADLILLANNPPEDPSTIRDNLGVMARGFWMARADIDKRLKEIADKYAAMGE